jgi:hypothetical protein
LPKDKKEVAHETRHMVMLVTVALVMAAMLSAAAVTALADDVCTVVQDPETGDLTEVCDYFDY